MNPLNETADLTATLAKNDIADVLLKLTCVQSCDSCRLWHRFKYTGEDGEPTVRRTIKVVFYVLHLADNFHVLRHFRCYFNSVVGEYVRILFNRISIKCTTPFSAIRTCCFNC